MIRYDRCKGVFIYMCMWWESPLLIFAHAWWSRLLTAALALVFFEPLVHFFSHEGGAWELVLAPVAHARSLGKYLVVSLYPSGTVNKQSAEQTSNFPIPFGLPSEDWR